MIFVPDPLLLMIMDHLQWNHLRAVLGRFINVKADFLIVPMHFEVY